MGNWKTKEKYNKKAYCRILLALKKDTGEKFKSVCKEKGLTVNGTLAELVEDWLSKNK